jgi:acetyl-CoA synthetase
VILRKIACNETGQLGDTSTLLNEEVVKEIIDNSLVK